MPMGSFFNNSVHSSGRFGLWIFPSYTPTVSGDCRDNRASVAKFSNFQSWSNDKGAEFVESNIIQFKNFTIWDQYTHGIATNSIISNENANSQYSNYFYDQKSGTSIEDSVIIGNSLNNVNSYTPHGIVIAWDRGQIVKNVTFYNFPDSKTSAFTAPFIIGKCTDRCGGWTTQFKELTFNNVKKRTLHRWNWDVIYQDLDGSFGGSPGDVIASKDNLTLNNPNCKQSNLFENGLVCSNTKTLKASIKQEFHKFIIASCIFNSKNNLVSNFKRSFSFSSLQSKLLN